MLLSSGRSCEDQVKARMTGLEPATFGSTVRCSNQIELHPRVVSCGVPLHHALSKEDKPAQGHQLDIYSERRGRPDSPRSTAAFFQAIPTGFEPVFSTVTGWRPLQTGPRDRKYSSDPKGNRTPGIDLERVAFLPAETTGPKNDGLRLHPS